MFTQLKVTEQQEDFIQVYEALLKEEDKIRKARLQIRGQIFWQKFSRAEKNNVVNNLAEKNIIPGFVLEVLRMFGGEIISIW